MQTADLYLQVLALLCLGSALLVLDSRYPRLSTACNIALCLTIYAGMLAMLLSPAFTVPYYAYAALGMNLGILAFDDHLETTKS